MICDKIAFFVDVDRIKHMYICNLAILVIECDILAREVSCAFLPQIIIYNLHPRDFHFDCFPTFTSPTYLLRDPPSSCQYFDFISLFFRKVSSFHLNDGFFFINTLYVLFGIQHTEHVFFILKRGILSPPSWLVQNKN